MIYAKIFEAICEKDNSRSSFKSPISSRPTESLIKSDVTPVETCSSGLSCWCVVLAG